MYCKNYSFRYGDLDRNRSIKIGSILEILQDISIAHSSSVGFALDTLYAQSNAFLVQGWRIQFDKKLIDGDAQVRTGIMQIRKFEAFRRYEILQDGEIKVRATAVWFLVDTERMKIALIPDKLLNAYESINDADNGYPFIKLRPQKDLIPVDSMKVERRDIDTNGHMNNVKSAEAALEGIPDDVEIKELQITYRKELFKGSRINLFEKSQENCYYAELHNEAGEPCVLVKAIYRPLV